MTRILAATTAFSALMTAQALAQSVFELDEIVFTATASPATLEQIGTSVSVVTREQLEATGETRVIDYLARLPGVDVRSRGPIGNLASITIRGAGQNYIRVLVDGIDVTDVSGPQVAYDFGSLSTLDVERIELLRGGQSALYGSEAIGGVINITTRRAEEGTVRQFVTLEAGSYATFRGSYGVSADLGAMDYALTFSRIQTDGFSAADENAGNTEDDAYLSNRLSFSIGHDLAMGGRIGLTGFHEESEAEFDEQFPIADGSPDEVTFNTSTGLRVFAEVPTGPIDSTFAATFFRIERDVRGSTGFGTANNLYLGERVGLSYLGTTTIAPGTELRFGLDATRETFEQGGDFGPGAGESEVVGIFGEIGWSPTEMFDLAATLRLDDHSQFGGLVSGRIAASWRPDADWILRASAAQSFRAPSLYELYGPFGEPTLQPEESRSFDLSAERRFGPDTYLRATLFYNETTNLIDFPFPYAQVPGTVRRRGAELEFGAPIGAAWRIDGSHTFTRGENPPLTAGNAWNLEFPEHDLSVTVTGDLTPRLSAGLSFQAVWDRPTLPDYTLANATVSYDLTEGVEAYLRIENLFDEEYQLQSGYGTSDRAIHVGLRASF